MQTNLAAFIKNTRYEQETDVILRACVHSEFCTATCPTYQLLGDERDRFLTSRNCESTCRSGALNTVGCCGAIHYHLSDQDGGLDNMRRYGQGIRPFFWRMIRCIQSRPKPFLR